MLQLKKLGKLITTYTFFIILESLLTKQRHSLPLASLACHALSPPSQNGAALQTKPSDSAWAASSAASLYGIDNTAIVFSVGGVEEEGTAAMDWTNAEESGRSSGTDDAIRRAKVLMSLQQLSPRGKGLINIASPRCMH